MNYIRHLTDFYKRTGNDERLNPNHISLYMALFQFWNQTRFRNSFPICRMEVMQLSKISSLNTYHKSIRDLNDFGYIKYYPSHNSAQGSSIKMYEFDTTDHTTDSTTGDTTNSTTYNNIYKHNKQHKHSVCKKYTNTQAPNKKLIKWIPPLFDEVKNFFTSEKFSEVEAEKFFNHFESNGWKVGGKSPMKNWKAAARNWMLNAGRFNTPVKFENEVNPVNLKMQKDYGEPL